MVNDKTPNREIFCNLLTKLIQKGVFSVGDVLEILEASNDDLQKALEKVHIETGHKSIQIGDETYVQDEDGQGWHVCEKCSHVESIKCNQCKFFGEDSAGISGCDVTCKIVSGNDAACNNFRIKR